jgi:hypothetical protein
MHSLQYIDLYATYRIVAVRCMVHAYCDTVQQETVRTGPDISSPTAPPGSLLESVFLLVFDRLPLRTFTPCLCLRSLSYESIRCLIADRYLLTVVDYDVLSTYSAKFQKTRHVSSFRSTPLKSSRRQARIRPQWSSPLVIHSLIYEHCTNLLDPLTSNKTPVRHFKACRCRFAS